MPTKKKAASSEQNTAPCLVVTHAQVQPLNQPAGMTVAICRVVLNDQIQLTGLRIRDGVSGLFVAYPNDPSYKGDDFRSLFYPLTPALRDHIEDVLLKEYQKILKFHKENT